MLHTAAALLGRLIRAIRAIVVRLALFLARVGLIDEWHVDLCKPFYPRDLRCQALPLSHRMRERSSKV